MKLAIISDIHEDLPYLECALRKIEKLKCNEIACIGDIVGFSVPHYKHFEQRNANACVELIAKYCRYVVAGNHDHYAVKKIPTHNPISKIPTNWYQLSYPERKQISQGEVWLYEENELPTLLSTSAIEWLTQLPEFLILEFSTIKLFLSHFIFPDITGFTTQYMHYIQQSQEHFNFIRNKQVYLSIFGHVHSPKILILNEQDNKIRFSKRLTLTTHSTAIGIPAIVRNSARSGFIVVNLNKMIIETHYL
ncbi:MAG: metallophosphatase family protein [Bacteroidales bacterium]|nr:metallophosphatase family protein [Bacteroidales bacterium]